MCFLGLQLAGVWLSDRHHSGIAVMGVAAGKALLAPAVTITPPSAARPTAAGNEENSRK